MASRPAPARWRVRLLGAVAASDDAQTIERFGSGGVAALLARLALQPGRRHSREELIDLLWPDAKPATARNRLRQALFTLRALLEPPAGVPCPVIVADRASIGLVEGALTCDVHAFECAAREGRHAEALALYAGELMPGHYDEWIGDERRRLAALAERAAEARDAVGARDAAAAATADAAAARTPPRASLQANNAAPTPEPAPAAARRERSPLPLYLTRFFGREEDAVQLRAAVAEHRLVTLLGPGGCGKTRLATEACWQLRETATAGTALLFVPLVGCASRAAMIEALAAALRLPAASGDAALASVIDALEARPTLLVLDNFEQLVESAGSVVATLVGSLAALHVLVTSRRALGLDGERTLLLAPLPLPAATASPSEAAASDALGLFVDRARAVRADFRVGAGNVGVLTRLVRALEGLPLALELAASRVRSVSLVEMLSQLEPRPGEPRSGLALLARSGVRSGHDPRHASMLRTIEWSWLLLAPGLQRLLAVLTVFEGGFTAAAAAAVASPAATPTLVQLDELVSHSLLGVQRSDDGGHAQPPQRYALDESIREFAAAMLDDAAARAVRARHRRWLQAWGDAMPATPPLAALRAESRNIGAALASALADGAPQEGAAAMVSLRRGLPDVVVPATQLAAFAIALDRCQDVALRSRGHTLLARLHLAAGAAETARRHADRGLALARTLHEAGSAAAPALHRGLSHDLPDDRRDGLPDDLPGGRYDGLLARALQVSASIVWRTLRDAARSEVLLDEAERLALGETELGVRASALALRGFIANIAHRDLARAEALHAEALAIWERAGDAVSANNGRYNLATCSMRAHRYEEALARLDGVIAEAERQHDWRLISQAHNVAGEAHCGLRAWPEASAAYRCSLELAWSVFAQPSVAYALWNLPRALAHCREPELAAAIAGAAEKLWATSIGAGDPRDRHDLRRVRRLAAVQIGGVVTAVCWARGAELLLPDAVALALGAASTSRAG